MRFFSYFFSQKIGSDIFVGDHLHEMSKPIFWKKNKINSRLLIFLPNVLSRYVITEVALLDIFFVFVILAPKQLLETISIGTHKICFHAKIKKKQKKTGFVYISA